MDKYKSMSLAEISKSELLKTKGGNPILVGLGVVSTLIGLGKSLDQASEWFRDGWNNPK
jgi:hypothetical protein